jgi:hypothetical protein
MNVNTPDSGSTSAVGVGRRLSDLVPVGLRLVWELPSRPLYKVFEHHFPFMSFSYLVVAKVSIDSLINDVYWGRATEAGTKRKLDVD